MKKFSAVLLAFAMSVRAGAAAEIQLHDVVELLSRPILGAEVTLAETQALIEAKLPVMPQARDGESITAQNEALRKAVLEQVVFRGEAAAWRDAECRVEWMERIAGGPGYHIRKLRYEALPGLWIPALLYEPDVLKGKAPVIVNVNGHDADGKAAPYKQLRCINQAKRGMLALNVEWYGMGQLRTDGFKHGAMNQIDLCGSGGIAVFYLAMQRGLDLLLRHPDADPERTAVMGLSGGGWQTIFFSALDPRVTFANPVAGYSSFFTRVREFSDLGDSEQTPSDLATLADYTHLTAMRAPRPTLLTFNAKDQCCFRADHALAPLLKAAEPVYAALGRPEHLQWHINEEPGTHNFEQDNREAMYRAMGKCFYPGDAAFDVREIPSEAEIKSAGELAVELPAENLDFNQIAKRLSHDMPPLASPKSGTELAEIVRSRDLGAAIGELTGEKEQGGIHAGYWRLKTGDGQWTIPAVELSAGKPGKAVLLAGEKGRRGAAESVQAHLMQGNTVFVIDPLYFGECAYKERAYLFALLLCSVGERPLGLQAGQILAVSRWIENERGLGRPLLDAVDERMRLIMAVAGEIGGMRHSTFGPAEEGRWPAGDWIAGELRKVIDANTTYEERPEVFCFGLLKGIVQPRS